MAASDSLVTARVIGDVLDPFNTSADLMVLFNGDPIISGMELRSAAVSDRPTVEIGGDDYRVAYTLVNSWDVDYYVDQLNSDAGAIVDIYLYFVMVVFI